MRTLLIGIDAACDRVLGPLLDEGHVPTLEGLFSAGVSGPLRSQVPPWTASAWPSLYTGTNPGKHGVFGFLSFDGYDHNVVDATRVRQPPLWELLDHRGLSSVVVNVPVTYPPRSFDGALVPGYTAPDPPPCHPEGVLDDVRDDIGDYRVYAAEEGDDIDDRAAQLADLDDLARLRGAAFEALVDRFDPDFGFLQFQVTDTVCHQFPGDRAALRRVYAAVDDAIEGALAAADPDTVCVASDHGIGPYDYRVAPNETLRDVGLVEATSDGTGMPTWASARESDLRETGGDGALARSLSGLAAGAARAGLTAQRVGAVLDRLGATETVLRHTPDSLVRAGSERVDFPESAAYVRSRVECGVRLNVAGRDPEGVVPPAEYDAVRERVVALLEGIETPDGLPVFETVGLREEFFEGPAADEAVDVVALPRAFDASVTSWLTGEPVERVPKTAWDHKREGVVALSGEGVDAAAPLDGAHLFDVAPTVLASLGLPVGDHMDGAVLPAVESAGTATYPERGSTGPAVGADDDVEDRLSSLGYLE